MCGIFGVVKRNGKIDVDHFRRLNAFQAHRGPDEHDVWVSQDGRLALGHNRLSIIDLKQGQQPMWNHRRTMVMVYNGEIYNFQELRKTLEAKGRRFTTTSDTEVALRSYEEWGEGCVNYFRGMFAFAIVDTEKQEIFLARDHFGIKPLVYYQDDHIFCFASEIQALSRMKNLDLALDLNALDAYLWLQYIPAPQTVYLNMRKLEPAHLMKIDFRGTVISKRRYWQPIFRPVLGQKFDAWLDALEEQIRQSVTVHTIADVPYGAFLSGGVDSTTVVKHLREIGASNIMTFSIGFREEGYNESAYAELAAKKFGTRHHHQIVTPDFFSVLEWLVERYGEPFGDSSAIPTYFVSQLASRHVKVVLSGDGGDELFGGYYSYARWRELVQDKTNREWLRRVIRFWLGILQPRQYPSEKASLAFWIYLNKYFGHRERINLWKPEYHGYANVQLKPFAPQKKLFKEFSLVQKAQFFDLTHYLPDDILTKVDIASMAHGLEIRLPFLDLRVAEFALTVPEEVNIQVGKWIGKLLLKKSLEKNFPSPYVYRKKQGFALPLDLWFSPQGYLYAEPYLHLINSDSKLFRQYFNLDAVYTTIAEGTAGQTYLLLFLEAWLKRYEQNHQRIAV